MKKTINTALGSLFFLTAFASFANANCQNGQTTTTYNNITILTDSGALIKLPMGTTVTLENLQPDGPTAYTHAQIVLTGNMVNLSKTVYPFQCNMQ
jgi:hypothetical protein